MRIMRLLLNSAGTSLKLSVISRAEEQILALAWQWTKALSQIASKCFEGLRCFGDTTPVWCQVAHPSDLAHCWEDFWRLDAEARRLSSFINLCGLRSRACPVSNPPSWQFTLSDQAHIRRCWGASFAHSRKCLGFWGRQILWVDFRFRRDVCRGQIHPQSLRTACADRNLS